jgi:hypothetical protein
MPARYDVFISYRRADTGRVLPLRDELRRLGYRVFFDTQSIDGGDDFKLRLQKDIAGSRLLVLCWSGNAAKSDIVTFEYSNARALNKPVIPWLLDSTPLPVMLDHINGIPSADAQRVAEAIRPRLGWPLAVRRRLQMGVAALLLVCAGAGVWWKTRPAPPWEMSGEVQDVHLNPVAGASVDVTEAGVVHHAVTAADGTYSLRLPQPQPAVVTVLFRKQGFDGDQRNIPTEGAYKETLVGAGSTSP